MAYVQGTGTQLTSISTRMAYVQGTGTQLTSISTRMKSHVVRFYAHHQYIATLFYSI